MIEPAPASVQQQAPAPASVQRYVRHSHRELGIVYIIDVPADLMDALATPTRRGAAYCRGAVQTVLESHGQHRLLNPYRRRATGFERAMCDAYHAGHTAGVVASIAPGTTATHQGP